MSAKKPMNVIGLSVLKGGRKHNHKPIDPIDPPPFAAGTPAIRRMEARAGSVIRQFKQENGNARIIARRFGVPVLAVTRLVARAMQEAA